MFKKLIALCVLSGIMLGLFAAPVTVMASDVYGWTVEAVGRSTAVVVQDFKASGEASLKVENGGNFAPITISQELRNLKTNTTYHCSIKFKANSARRIGWGFGEDINYVPNGTYEWRTHTFEYVTGATVPSVAVFNIVSVEGGTVWVDDVFVAESDGENIIVNGGFEATEAISAPLYSEPDSIENLPGWDVGIKGDGRVSVAYDIKAAGDASLKIENTGAVITIEQELRNIKSNTQYECRIMFRAENGRNVWWGPDGTKAIRYINNGTYDWREYTFVYTTDRNAPNTMAFKIMSESSGTVWVDEIFVAETGGENIVSNPSFESTAVQRPSDSVILNDVTNRLKNMDTFEIDYLPNTLGLGRNLPVMRTTNMTIDGSLNDWSEHTVVNLPVDSQQLWRPVLWQGVDAHSGIVMLAYDDNSLYMALEVTDDIHHPDDTYWQGDSIQVAFGQGLQFGPELGFLLNKEGISQVIHPAADLGELIDFEAVRTGNKTVYEIALPWETIHGEKPEESFLFNVLINDNNGTGRANYIEWTPGIGQSKNSEDFVELVLVPEGSEMQYWIESAKTFEVNAGKEFQACVVNTADSAKKIEISVPGVNLNRTVEVAGKTFMRIKFEVEIDQGGDHSVDVILKDEDGFERTITRHFYVSPDVKYLEAKLADIEKKKLPAVARLLDLCAARGIATDYEMVDYLVIKEFINYAKEELELSYIEYANNSISNMEWMAEEVTATLRDYINGVSSPQTLTRYVDGPIEISGSSYIGKAVDPITGEEEIRPLFLTGYGHFAQIRNDIPIMHGLGNEMVQNEIGPQSTVINPNSLFFWNTEKLNNVIADASLDTEVMKDGDGSLRITCESNREPNVYIMLTQRVSVKPNTKYIFNLDAKGQSDSAFLFCTSDWTVRTTLSGSYDWKNFSFEHNTGPNETSIDLILTVDGITSGLWIDNISIKEDGTGSNLIKNGDFEQIPVTDGEYGVSPIAFETIENMLIDAEKNNIAVDILLSPHYFPQWIFEKYPHLHADTYGMFNHDIYDPEAMRVVELHTRATVERLKDYSALKSVCLTNEPVFDSSSVFDIDNPNCAVGILWREYLQETHGSIEQLNKVYSTSYRNFESVPMPDKNEPTAQVYDWMYFNSRIFADWHQWMADIVHEVAPDLPVHAKIMFNSLIPRQGSNTLRWGVDPEMFAEFSQISGNDAFNCIYDTSASVHAKMKWYDLLFSMKEMPQFNSEDHFIHDRTTQFIPEQRPHARTDVWQGAIHGRSASAIWTWERDLDNDSDFGGSLLHRPDVVSVVGKTSLDLNRLAHEVTALMTEPAKTAILYSSPSRLYSPTYLEAIDKAYTSMIYNGQVVGFVTEKQIIEDNCRSINTIVIPMVTHLDAKVIPALKRFIEQGGNVVIIGEESLSKDYYNRDIDNADREYVFEHATVIEVTLDRSGSGIVAPDEITLRNLLGEAFREAGLMDVVLIDNETGETVYDVSWRSTVYNGQILVNVCYYKWSDNKNVSLQINGKTVDAGKDLITGLSFNGEDIELSPYMPMLLSAEEGWLQ